MLTPEEQTRVRKKALMLLEYMDRTEKGLAERLRRAGFESEAIEDAMLYVRAFGYVDDARYAENYIFERIKTRSRARILRELAEKGVDRETAAAAWDSVAEMLQPDEMQLLRDTIAGKYPPGTKLDEKEMRRLQSFLVRRGFSYGDIQRALSQMQISGRFLQD